MKYEFPSFHGFLKGKTIKISEIAEKVYDFLAEKKDTLVSIHQE